MCGCSPVCMSFFDTHRAVGSFAHAPCISMRRIPVAGRHGVSGFRSGSVTRARPPSRDGFPESGHRIGRSASRLGTPRQPPRAGRLRRIPLQAARLTRTAGLPRFRSSFRPRRPSGWCRSFRLRAMGNACRPSAPFFASRIPLETSTDIRNHPRSEGSVRSIRPVTACAVAPRFSSRSSTLIELPDRSRTRHASPCDASRSRAVMAFSASGPHRSRVLASDLRQDKVFSKPTLRSAARKPSGSSPPSAAGGRPSANSVPGCASGAGGRLPPVSFLLPAATPERARPVVQSPGGWERTQPVRPFPRFPGSLPKPATELGIVPGGMGATAPSGPSGISIVRASLDSAYPKRPDGGPLRTTIRRIDRAQHFDICYQNRGM